MGGDADDDEARDDVRGVHDFGPVEDRGGGGIHGQRGREVADVGRLAAARGDAEALFAQHGEHVFGAVDKLREDCARDGLGVAVDG